jgi:hypothetical protein
MDHTDDDPLLTTAETAARLGIAPATWRWHVTQGSGPPPDDPDDGHPAERRMPRWRLSTVKAWEATRRGPGRPKRPEEEA